MMGTQNMEGIPGFPLLRAPENVSMMRGNESLLTSLPAKSVAHLPNPAHPLTTTSSTHHVPYVPWPPHPAPAVIPSLYGTSRTLSEYDKSIMSSRTLSVDSRRICPITTSAPSRDVHLPFARETSLTTAAVVTKTAARGDSRVVVGSGDNGGLQHGGQDSTSVSYQYDQGLRRPSTLPRRWNARDSVSAPRSTRFIGGASSSTKCVTHQPLVREQLGGKTIAALSATFNIRQANDNERRRSLVSMPPSPPPPRRPSGPIAQNARPTEQFHNAAGVAPAATRVPIHLSLDARACSPTTRFCTGGNAARGLEEYQECAPRTAEDGSSIILRNSYHALQRELQEQMCHHIQQQMKSASTHMRTPSGGRIGGLRTPSGGSIGGFQNALGHKGQQQTDSRNISPISRENVFSGPQQLIGHLHEPTPSFANLSDSVPAYSYAITRQHQQRLEDHLQQLPSSFPNPHESSRNRLDENQASAWFPMHDMSIERRRRPERDLLLEPPGPAFGVFPPYHPSAERDGSPGAAASRVFVDGAPPHLDHSATKPSKAQLVRPIIASPLPLPRQSSSSSFSWESPPPRAHSNSRSLSYKSLLTNTTHVLGSVVPHAPDNAGAATLHRISLAPEDDGTGVSTAPFPAERRRSTYLVDDHFRTIGRPRDLKRGVSPSPRAIRPEATEQSSHHHWRAGEMDAASPLESTPAVSAEESARKIRDLHRTYLARPGIGSPGSIKQLPLGITDSLARQSHQDRPSSPSPLSLHTSSPTLQSCYSNATAHPRTKNRSPFSAPAFSLPYKDAMLAACDRPYVYARSTTSGPSNTTSCSLRNTQQHTVPTAHHLLRTKRYKSECSPDSRPDHLMDSNATRSTCPALHSSSQTSSETIFSLPHAAIVPAPRDDGGVLSTKYERETETTRPPTTDDQKSAAPGNGQDMLDNNTPSTTGSTISQPSHNRAIKLGLALSAVSVMPLGNGLAPPQMETRPSKYHELTASRGERDAQRDAASDSQDGIRGAATVAAVADHSFREDVRLFMLQTKVSLASLLCDDKSELPSTVAANIEEPYSGPLPHRSVRSPQSRPSSRDGTRDDVHFAQPGSKAPRSRSESPYGGPLARVVTCSDPNELPRSPRGTVGRKNRSSKSGIPVPLSDTSLTSGEELLYSPSKDSSSDDEELGGLDADDIGVEEILYQWSSGDESAEEEDDCGAVFVTPMDTPRGNAQSDDVHVHYDVTDDGAHRDDVHADDATAEGEFKSTDCVVEKRISATERMRSLLRLVTLQQ
eukprot:GEMP01002956.1.p1 GENE.GEMP01002956.1~~GEMP01002956.1.p1  ORF type:complete len:1264 (+),score=314.78 GEMP01002956.1:150-3941(+)